jgi:hypothetical protein
LGVKDGRNATFRDNFNVGAKTRSEIPPFARVEIKVVASPGILVDAGSGELVEY